MFKRFALSEGPKIPAIMEKVACKKHRAEKGSPCWSIFPQTREDIHFGICNMRVKSAGFTGLISNESLRRRTK